MTGRGAGTGTIRLIRVSLADAANHEAVDVSRKPGGAISNPPLWDEKRQIAVAYDSAHGVMRAFRFHEKQCQLVPIWEIPNLGCASHMLLLPDSGNVVTNDFAKREAVALIDIETGQVRDRADIGGYMQGVTFPAPGWNNDFY